jgi:hypothetical protein
LELAAGEEKHLFRLGRHILSQLVCMGRHTMTNLITTGGRQYVDWTADYRLYSQSRIDCESLFALVRQEVQDLNNDKLRLITALDDSLIRKSGKKIPGLKYTRDPMGPPFCVNFVRGQRVIQMSAAITRDGQSRMIPVDFQDASTPNKPERQASESEWSAYRQECKVRRLSIQGVECIQHLRAQMPESQALWVAVDGSYTNQTVLKNLPQKTVLIGRIRGDAKLYYPPQAVESIKAGRKRYYGAPAPTPEAIRQDDNHPWQSVRAFAAGQYHDFKVKVVKDLRWRGNGERNLQVIVIAPLHYRLTQHSRLLYRKPGYLICTAGYAPLDQILQAYLWRWGIETNFRDEKTLLGTGEAQVRNPSSVKAIPQMMVASYSLLLLAGLKLWGVKGLPPFYKLPKWRNLSQKSGASTNDLIKQLRSEFWADSIAATNLNDFAIKSDSPRSLFNIQLPAYPALLEVISN